MTADRPRIDIENLRRASREPVVEALSRFVRRPVAEWLRAEHRTGTGQFLTADGRSYSTFNRLSREFTEREVLDVLSATGPSHCLDGWTFLSRALAALLSGDTHTARHLAYYAQLRAGLSLLHCHGIGIFNGINFAVDASGELHSIDMTNASQRGLGTHSAVWQALRSWADYSDSARVFLNSVQFRGVSLVDCIDAIWPSAGPAPLASKVIETWGVDLRRSAEERESRNVSSYCAHAFNAADSNLSLRLDLVDSIWRGLEPGGGGGFPSLDRHLLRKLLDLMKAEQPSDYGNGNFWDTAYRRLDPRVRAFVSKEFLKHVEERSDPPIFRYANSRRQGDVHAMVSRALLLLRAAAGVVRSTFVDAQFDLHTNDLQPWFDTVGVDRGFWKAGHPPEQLDELWDEVSYAVEDLASYNSTNPGQQLDFLSSLRSQAVLLSQAERACIWGIGV